MTTIPNRTEAAEYYFTYIDQVPAGDICEILRAQAVETVSLLRGIPDEKSLHRYAPDKWSIRELVSHVNDGERLFVFGLTGLRVDSTARCQASIRTSRLRLPTPINARGRATSTNSTPSAHRR